ncbi:MAG: thioredoxin domain-containing protein [Ignavibacteria bacterium]
MKSNRLFFIFISIALILNSCTAHKDEEEKHFMYTNKLISETSPYLLQHAHNPVNWYPWGDEALQKAADENKLLLISIGYSACHWCHVMEHESFEDTVVAKIMNEHFVSIKVDREERPDIDQVYRDAAYVLTGRGGWPLNVIALPDGQPVYAGTYFPRGNWIKLLEYFKDNYQKDPALFKQEADKISKALAQLNIVGSTAGDLDFIQEDVNNIFRACINKIDFTNGGMIGAPKFPLPNIFEFFLTYYYHTEDQNSLKAVTTLLDKMVAGGIYDQLGGGFARYSTDDIWKVPHFEKMLYDNAQLVSLYSNAYKITKEERYKEVVYQTLEFVKREMTDESNGFYSAYDADSEGEEGKYYVWSKKEIEHVLGNDAELYCEYFSITNTGNWESGNNILFRTNDIKGILNKYEMEESTLNNKIIESNEILFKEREKRVKPGLDDKILTSWNALMLKGFADAFNAFGEKSFLETAIKNAEFLSTEMMENNGRLYRNYKNGNRSINGFLDDYSFTIEAFISLYESTFDEKWLYKAKTFSEYVIAHFKDENTGLFYYTSNLDDPLITRKMELSDNVIPASNSSLAKGLFKLGKYFYNDEYISTAKSMLGKMKQQIEANPLYHSNWCQLMSYFVYPYFEVAIIGEEFESKLSKFLGKFYPNVTFMGGNDEGTMELLKQKKVNGRTFIYVCVDKSCRLPVEDVDSAEGQIK